MNAPSRKVASGIALLLVIACLVFALKQLWQREPSYNGKPLSAWADQYGTNHWTGRSRAADKEAEAAIQQIGPKGIPFFLGSMRASDSALKKQLRTMFSKAWQDRLHLNDNSGKARRIGAHGLAALGTNASSAVPALIDLARNHPEEDGRYLAVWTLGYLGGAAEPAIPFLVECLTNKVESINEDAAMGLGHIGRRADLCVPALIQYLDIQIRLEHFTESAAAVGALLHFGTNASTAAPVLKRLLNHPDENLRSTATNALRRIDSNAGIKRQN
jgi:hypothetical protein